jgi:murein L,D-transpeptidase YafK
VQGDGRTPEGEYYECVRNDHSKYYLSLGISYPNKEDAQAALSAGIISQSVYEQIASAIDNGSRPPWDTALGGSIMIHGGGATDWTAGCIAVENDVMDVLWKYCPIGTPIRIVP